MASAITSAFDFNQEELKDISEIIGERFYTNPQIASLHDIEQGVKYNKQIVFAGKKGLVASAMTGCTPNEIDGIVFTEKTWTPVDHDFRLPHCSADVNAQDKLLRQFARMNPDFYNVLEGSNSSVGNFLIAFVEDALMQDIIWKTWFSDTAADIQGNGGEFVDTVDIDRINTFDGFFKQLEAAVASEGLSRQEIAKNAEASFAAQALAANEGLEILRGMYEKADSRLIADPNKKFMVTRTIYDNLLTTYEERESNGGLLTRLENGGGLAFRGVEVVNMATVWDVFIDTYLNDGTARVNPHRALLTIPTNIPLGTVNDADFITLDAFYDKKDKTNYVDAAFNLDVKFLEAYLGVVAY